MWGPNVLEQDILWKFLRLLIISPWIHFLLELWSRSPWLTLAIRDLSEELFVLLLALADGLDGVKVFLVHGWRLRVVQGLDDDVADLVLKFAGFTLLFNTVYAPRLLVELNEGLSSGVLDL
jgi:hypothetical protein